MIKRNNFLFLLVPFLTSCGNFNYEKAISKSYHYFGVDTFAAFLDFEIIENDPINEFRTFYFKLTGLSSDGYYQGEIVYKTVDAIGVSNDTLYYTNLNLRGCCVSDSFAFNYDGTTEEFNNFIITDIINGRWVVEND